MHHQVIREQMLQLIDALPTWLLKECVDELVQAITRSSTPLYNLHSSSSRTINERSSHLAYIKEAFIVGRRIGQIPT